MNGYDATKEIREIEKSTGAHIPIIATTADVVEENKERCFHCGMDEFISKPVSAEILKEKLAQWIDFKDSKEEQRSDTLLAPLGKSPLNLSILHIFSAGDTESEKKVLSIFIEQSDRHMKTLAEACAKSEILAWHETASILMNAASSIGANEFAKLCNDAQLFGGTADDAAVLLGKMENEYARIKEHLRMIGLVS